MEKELREAYEDFKNYTSGTGLIVKNLLESFLSLKGFPDGWTEGISDSQRYKCLGNAVTTNVIEWIIMQMFKVKEERCLTTNNIGNT